MKLHILSDLRLIKKITQTIAVAVTSFGIAATSSFADSRDFEQCRQFFANGNPPVIQHQTELQPRALCFSAFAVLHSGKSRTPIYVAEKINKEVLLDAQGNERTDQFYEEARLPQSERSQLEDYRGSGFDRGHMAPAGDMATKESMAQSFSLANMIPQYPVNNRKSWASIEKANRKYVMRAAGDVYVITGPVFDGTPRTIGENRVWIPTHLFKLVYDPSKQRAWSHWIENSDDAIVGKPISYDELVRRTGIEYLPGFNQD